MCGSARPFSGSVATLATKLEVNIDSGCWAHPLEQPSQRSRRHSHASRRWSAIRSGDVQEHRAAASGDARAGVVVDLDHKVVEAVGAPQEIAWFIGRALKGAIVSAIPRVF